MFQANQSTSFARAMSADLDCSIDPAILTRVLCELGEVDDVRDLGTRGPLMASAEADSLFHCLFGRDAIRMAMDLLEEFPTVARASLRALASLQGVRTNSRSEEEPGRVLHEHRRLDDPRAIRLSKVWDWPYYGAIDTTPQWINLAVAYSAVHGMDILEETVTDRLGRRIKLRDSLLAAVEWILRRLDDPAGAGYLWARRALETGNRNQVFEDSSDAFHHVDGTLFDPSRPFAPVAVQGYSYDALLGAAHLLEQSTGPALFAPNELRRRAEHLRAMVLAKFWQPDLRTFAHALTIEVDGSTRPARVVASGPGHLLTSTLLDGPEVASIRESLIARFRESDLLAGAGIRTKSTSDPLFRPGSYHNGSVWPMDTGVIAEGLRRHGCADQADDLETRILRACAEVRSFPEFFRGEVDGGVSININPVTYLRNGEVHFREQPPQMKQGWTVTRVWRILRRRGVSMLRREAISRSDC
jgi:glycogen debranching enzyme